MGENDDFISIFNDVLGPVMRGPSSSHSAGAYRVAKLARSLYGGVPESIRCSFDPAGSYAPTYKALGVDLAFCAGVIGWEMTDPKYESAIKEAAGILNVDFVVEPLEYSDHPNTVRLEMDGQYKVVLWARSVGGGGVEIFRLNEWPVCITGKQWEAFFESTVDNNPMKDVESGMALRFCSVDRVVRDGKALYHLRLKSGDTVTPDEMGDGLKGLDGVNRPWIAEPLFFPQKGNPLFKSATTLLEYAEQNGETLGEAGIEYEAKLLGLTRNDVITQMTERYLIMRHSVDEGMRDESSRMAWLRPHASRIMEAAQGQLLPFGGYAAKAAARALAVMHICNSRGVVCAAPTGGSAGVLPGVVLTLKEDFGISRDAIARALFAAGAIGLIIACRATFAAEEAGCQVEIGAAGAMAAAAAMESAGGTAREALDAASISLQNTMGMICDPVGGGCEIPCHTRNAAAAAGAFTTADLVRGGYPNPIPLDEAIDASAAVGRSLPSEFRCTARGGIAVVPSALRLVRENPL